MDDGLGGVISTSGDEKEAEGQMPLITQGLPFWFLKPASSKEVAVLLEMESGIFRKTVGGTSGVSGAGTL
jgi:hypothetical protein